MSKTGLKMSFLAENLKKRIIKAMPLSTSQEKNRLAYRVRQSFDILEKTSIGRNLFLRLPKYTCFSVRKSLQGNFGMTLKDGEFIGLACDKLSSLKQVVPVIIHECAHVIHNEETKKIRFQDQSVFEGFLYDYLDELGARISEKKIIQECIQKKLLLYNQNFFSNNPAFYNTRTTLYHIYQDIDESYLDGFLQNNLVLFPQIQNSTRFIRVKHYFQKMYPEFSPQTYRHIQQQFRKIAKQVHNKSSKCRLTQFQKKLLAQINSRERD